MAFRMSDVSRTSQCSTQVLKSNTLENFNFSFKLCTLIGYSGFLDDVKFARTDPSPFATVQIIERGQKVFPQDIVLKPGKRNAVKKDIYDFNQKVDTMWPLPELTPDAVLIINFYVHVPFGDHRGNVPVGGTSMRLYSKHKLFRTGFFTLQVWADQEATNQPEYKPWKFVPRKYEIKPGKVSIDQNKRYYKIQKDIRRYQKGLIYSGKDTDWLDAPALTKLENELEEVRKARKEKWFYAVIQLPEYRREQGGPARVLFQEIDDSKIPAKAMVEEVFPRELVKMVDPDIGKTNLCEDKYHKMCRSKRTAAHARADKPNAQLQKVLERYIAQPPTVPSTAEESTHLWSYRFWLAKHKRALVRFLRCVDWSVDDEATQAEELLHQWEPVEPVDALALLSHEFSGRKVVRQYAVSRMRTATDEELLLYLLQLVQALRYEDKEVIAKVQPVRYNAGGNGAADNARRATVQSAATDDEANQIAALLMEAANEEAEEEEEDLATFLINRAVRNSILANYLYWYLTVEATVENPLEPHTVEMYKTMLARFSNSLKNGHMDHRVCRSQLNSQNCLVRQLCEIMDRVAADSANRQKKIELLRRLLASGPSAGGGAGGGGAAVGQSSAMTLRLDSLESPFPLPLDPVHKICGLDVSQANLFKSAKMPAKLNFKTTEDLDYVVIFKNGDDLRQDQLVVQLIQLVDRILQQENLDLRLTPYKVLATSTRHGFVQYVESETLQVVKRKYGSIHEYLKKHNPNPTGPFGIQKEVMNNYIRSCAGYCIITYLLGVGDRHLENILLTRDGKLFHIDFGYILGRDPKLAPSPMRISSEMVDALGGSFATEQAKEFLSFCFTAFLGLRKKANLLINLFSLMRDAGIPDIAIEPDKAVQKLSDRFFLSMSEEQAVSSLVRLIIDSASAIIPAVTDQMHALMQARPLN